MASGTVLVVITTNAADTGAVTEWLRGRLTTEQVARANGFYAAISALESRPRAVVVDLGAESSSASWGRDDWRLAELRARAREAAFVVVADAVVLPMLAGATHADLAVTSADRLPPLREVLLTDEPVVDDQTSWRRSSR